MLALLKHVDDASPTHLGYIEDITKKNAVRVVKVKTKGTPLSGTHHLKVLKHYRLRL